MICGFNCDKKYISAMCSPIIPPCLLSFASRDCAVRCRLLLQYVGGTCQRPKLGLALSYSTCWPLGRVLEYM